jgi:hypothetical protein
LVAPAGCGGCVGCAGSVGCGGGVGVLVLFPTVVCVVAVGVGVFVEVVVQPAIDIDKETMITSDMATAVFFIILFTSFSFVP